MDKEQALHNFWSSFGLPAYDENTVPETATLPYITYEVVTDSLGDPVSLNASLWYRQYSWKEITQKSEEIARAIQNQYPPSIPIDGGRLYITKGTPFARRAAEDEDKTIRRIILNITAEYFTAY